MELFIPITIIIVGDINTVSMLSHADTKKINLTPHFLQCGSINCSFWCNNYFIRCNEGEANTIIIQESNGWTNPINKRGDNVEEKKPRTNIDSVKLRWTSEKLIAPIS